MNTATIRLEPHRIGNRTVGYTIYFCHRKVCYLDGSRPHVLRWIQRLQNAQIDEGGWKP